ncbi:MAG: hypothetical protein ACTSVE_01525, partial [Candidatus Helarchaeota archaeon]
NFTTFSLENNSISSNTSFYWHPSDNPLSIGGTYNFLAYWTNGTESSICTIDFLLLPNPTNLTIISNVSRNPFVNDTSQMITVFYNESNRNYNITSAYINATLNGLQQSWEDVYLRTFDTADKGKYLVKINTTGFSAGTYYLNISATKDGYEMAEILSIPIQVDPVPTTIVSTKLNITQYEKESISLTISFKDTYHEKDIDWANVSFNIVVNATFNITGNLTLTIPGESIYANTSISLLDIPGKNYTINITATASDCETSHYSLDLFVLNKTTPILEIISVSVKSRSALVLNPFTITDYYEGDVITITLRLTNATDSSGLDGKTIKIEFISGISDVYAITANGGYAIVEVTIPGGINSLSFKVMFEEIAEIAEGELYSGSLTITTSQNLLLWNLIFIGIIIGIAVGISLTIYVSRKKSRLRKIEQRKKELKKIQNKFENVAAMQALLVIVKDSGNCIYNQQFQVELNADLISGFLTAISAFQVELRKDKAEENVGFELKYGEYNILLVDRQLIRAALILDKEPDDDLREILNKFSEKFENRYRENLINFDGNLNPYKQALPLVLEHLRLSLLYPHNLSASASQFVATNRFPNNFSDLDKTLVKLANTIMKTNNVEYFYLPHLIEMGAAGLESNLEVFGSVEKLIELKFFLPIES